MSLPSSPACNRDCQKQGMSTSTDAARYASGPPREAWHDMNMWVALISFTILETDGGRFHAQGRHDVLANFGHLRADGQPRTAHHDGWQVVMGGKRIKGRKRWRRPREHAILG